MRFGTKSLLIGFMLLAFWLSTFSGYAAAREVRQSILLTVFLSSILRAAYCRGRRQAFWIGFSSVMLIMGTGTRLFWVYVPMFDWIDLRGREWAKSFSSDANRWSELGLAIYWTVWTGWMLMLSTLVGLIGAHVYDHSRNTKD
jgi:hypothetical protein